MDADWNDDEIAEQPPVRRRKRRGGVTLSLSMTPMIDVVFLLLIYFMVATDFRMGEEVFRMDVPGGEAQRDPFTLDEEPLRINVVSTGISPEQYRLNLDGPYPQPATFEELYEFLNSRQVNESNTMSGALFAPAHPILIQPTRRTRWEHAIEAFNAAARAKYTNITFATPG